MAEIWYFLQDRKPRIYYENHLAFSEVEPKALVTLVKQRTVIEY